MFIFALNSIMHCFFMIKSKKFTIILFLFIAAFYSNAQINTDRMLAIGRNALYFEDYVLAIQYFINIGVKAIFW